MTDDTAERRDHWAAEAQAAWQNVQELRYYLVLALQGALDSDDMEKVRVLLERTKP